MPTPTNQEKLLRLVAYLNSVISSSEKSPVLNLHEKQKLTSLRDEMLGAASAISTLVSSENQHVDKEVIFKAVYVLCSAAIDISTITRTSDAAKRFHIRNNTQSGRVGLAKKLELRDEVLRRELGPLLAQGLKGEKLRTTLIEIFAREGVVDPKRAKPGLRRVQDWVKEYRDQGMWRPDTQS